MSIEQTANALMRVQQLREEISSNGSFDGRDIMKGRCLSYADISCDIEVGAQIKPCLLEIFIYFDIIGRSRVPYSFYDFV